MQVTSGAEWVTNVGNKRSYALTLDIDDLKEIKGIEAVDAMSRKEILSELNRTVEILVVGYISSEGGMSPEFAQKRIAEIKNG